VDIRTLPFVRFEGNEAHNQFYGLNLGEGVDGVGPDSRHPLRLTGTRIWNAWWAFRPASPSMLVDDMRIHASRYGIFLEVHDRHAYQGFVVSETEIPRTSIGAYALGKRAEAHPGAVEAAGKSASPFPHPLTPVDDLPPATVITSAAPASSGRLVVRGTTSDNGSIRKVLVNGREARATAPNFAEWEITLDRPRAGEPTLTAHGEDAAGNVEKLAHELRVP
jgi:hypothetical protein